LKIKGTMTEEKRIDAVNDSLLDRDLSSLEPGQLTEAKQHHFPRRTLRGPQTLVLWSLRIYLLFMIAVVVYQIWSGAN
jgi:hypothetical protein